MFAPTLAAASSNARRTCSSIEYLAAEVIRREWVFSAKAQWTVATISSISLAIDLEIDKLVTHQKSTQQPSRLRSNKANVSVSGENDPQPRNVEVVTHPQ